MGPHPFPMIVRDFQAVISKEIKEQILEKEEKLSDVVVAYAMKLAPEIKTDQILVGSAIIKLLEKYKKGVSEICRNIRENDERKNGGINSTFRRLLYFQ